MPPGWAAGAKKAGAAGSEEGHELAARGVAVAGVVDDPVVVAGNGVELLAELLVDGEIRVAFVPRTRPDAVANDRLGALHFHQLEADADAVGQLSRGRPARVVLERAVEHDRVAVPERRARAVEQRVVDGCDLRRRVVGLGEQIRADDVGAQQLGVEGLGGVSGDGGFPGAWQPAHDHESLLGPVRRSGV
ncbi:hypothetical protein VNG_1963H [Halobacterium salinarum NRC-1]|uniref:Spurious ORF n=1 Tax=Halobacterium salinarum (strain ATCC 700922 / JCM 11081 / NRC-1) TaxID=64091 RepID=Q9HNS8_HALSA|nr:hypothetical protein VNG_1963H [Halobacterium salinarum NRC-1]DAC78882.1 TPA_inf: spurious ORF [Halobacterium salinarum NRC-1]